MLRQALEPKERYGVSFAGASTQALIEPNNSRATLGTMLKVSGNSPQRFATAIPAAANSGKTDIDLVVDMMSRLRRGQTSRHGSQSPTQMETQQQAEMAVHLAAALVQWFAAGLVRRTP
jgi:hypothetical protein